MFLLYEMIVGKPAPQKLLEVAQVAGFIFLLLVMVLAMGNDLFRVFTGQFG
jgi:regulator of sigma E protease